MVLLQKREIYIETGLLNNKSLGVNQRYLHHFFTFPKIHASLWKIHASLWKALNTRKQIARLKGEFAHF